MWNLRYHHYHSLFNSNIFYVWVNISFADCNKLAIIREGGGGAGSRGDSKTGRSGPFHIVCESDLVILKNAFMMRWLAFHAEKKLKSRRTKKCA